jgi:DNA-binding NarL/FixJ family response regulator
VNVRIVSDVRLHREGLACLLERVPGVTVGGAIDVESALCHPLRGKADVALLDGFGVIRKRSAERPSR